MSDIASSTGVRTRDFFCRPTEEGWRHFVDKYGPRIFGWCRAKGLKDHAAEEVVQNVLVKLFSTIHSSPWDETKGNLRCWLKTVTRHAIADYFGGLPPESLPLPDWSKTVAENEDLSDEIANAEIWSLAEAETQLEVGGKKWECFRLRTLENIAVADVAARLGLANVNTVYNYVSEVGKVFRAKLIALGYEFPDGSAVNHECLSERG